MKLRHFAQSLWFALATGNFMCLQSTKYENSRFPSEIPRYDCDRHLAAASVNQKTVALLSHLCSSRTSAAWDWLCRAGSETCGLRFRSLTFSTASCLHKNLVTRYMLHIYIVFEISNLLHVYHYRFKITKEWVFQLISPLTHNSSFLHESRLCSLNLMLGSLLSLW